MAMAFQIRAWHGFTLVVRWNAGASMKLILYILSKYWYLWSESIPCSPDQVFGTHDSKIVILYKVAETEIM